MISVFICDDQPFYINALKIFFKRQEDINIIGDAQNGIKALSAITELDPDVCIIDLSMPAMDGVSLIQKLNAIKSPAKKIVLSQNSGKEWLDRLISNEIDAFILKTDEKEHLLNAVRAVSAGEKYFSPTVASIFYNLLSQNNKSKAGHANTPSLSEREREIAIYISKGLTVKEIASKTQCSENTIKTHKSNLMRKIEARNSAEVTSWVFRFLES